MFKTIYNKMSSVNLSGKILNRFRVHWDDLSEIQQQIFMSAILDLKEKGLENIEIINIIKASADKHGGLIESLDAMASLSWIFVPPNLSNDSVNEPVDTLPHRKEYEELKRKHLGQARQASIKQTTTQIVSDTPNTSSIILTDTIKDNNPVYPEYTKEYDAFIEKLSPYLKKHDLKISSGVNDKFADGDTPLIQAASKNELDIVYNLLAKGADPTVKNKDGLTADRVARRAKHGNIAQILVYAKDWWRAEGYKRVSTR